MERGPQIFRGAPGIFTIATTVKFLTLKPWSFVTVRCCGQVGEKFARFQLFRQTVVDNLDFVVGHVRLESVLLLWLSRISEMFLSCLTTDYIIALYLTECIPVDSLNLCFTVLRREIV